MMPAVEIVHDLHGQHNKSIAPRLSLGSTQPKTKLATAFDHIIEDLVDRVLILTGPFTDRMTQLTSIPSQEHGGRSVSSVLGSIRKQPS
jgi:hypothetical protein